MRLFQAIEQTFDAVASGAALLLTPWIAPMLLSGGKSDVYYVGANMFVAAEKATAAASSLRRHPRDPPIDRAEGGV